MKTEMRVKNDSKFEENIRLTEMYHTELKAKKLSDIDNEVLSRPLGFAWAFIEDSSPSRSPISLKSSPLPHLKYTSSAMELER